MKLIAVLEQFAHHNRATSPDNMINYIHYDLVIMPRRIVSNDGKIKRKIRYIIDRFFKNISGMNGYSIASAISELKVLKCSYGGKQLIHFYNGDINCKYFPFLKGENIVVATYHQPPDYFYEFFRKCSHIRLLDAIVVTSNVQKELFSKYIDKEKIFFMPLAVDVNLFKPVWEDVDRPPSVAVRKGNKKICLFVGNWLRDFETMQKVIAILKGHNEIEFHIVTLPDNKRFFEGFENVKFYSGIPFEAYMNELHMADILVVPMKSCTSNLAILEAMAVGLPIISTDVGGIRDYVNESFAILHKRGDYKAMADSIIDLLSDEKCREVMSSSARGHSMKFSWSVISQRLKNVYRSLGATI